MWSNKYIGIPYLDNGRDTAGTDCWGLVRLIYKEELDIDLPSFYSDYTISDTDRIAELLNQYREGWEQLSLPEEKCVVLFQIMGKVSHIGIMINEKQFIHNRRNQAASVESLDSVKWKNRVVGFFKYNEKSKELFETLPAALKATEIVIEFNEDLTIADAFTAAYENAELTDDLKKRILVFVDGKQVDKEKDGSTKLVSGQKLEYRLLPEGDDIGRTLLTIAVIVVAVKFAPVLVANAMGASAASASAAALAYPTATMLVQSGIMMVGMALVNAIAPIRPPDLAGQMADAGSSNPQLLLTGARNEARQYEAIPVVLGTYRYVPPVAAVNFLTVDTDISYLRMLLCWGYGPLDVDSSSLRIGSTPFSQYYDKEYDPKTGEVSSTDALTSPVLEVYGRDITQINPGIDLPYTLPSGDPNFDTVYRTIPEQITSLSVSLHFPQGLRGIYKTGSSAGAAFPVAFTFKVRARKLDKVTLLPIDPSSNGWIKPGLSFYQQPVTLGMSRAIASAYGNIMYNYAPGYVTNIVYINKYGALGIASGTACLTSSATSGIVSAALPIIGYESHDGGGGYTVPIYGGSPDYLTGPAVPGIPEGAKALYTIKTYYTSPTSYSIFSTTDHRTTNGITGGDILSTSTTNSKIVITLATGGNPSSTGDFTYGLANQPYYLRKDAFTDTISFTLDINDPSPYEVSVLRASSDEADFSDRIEYKQCSLFLITGYNANVSAVQPPKNTTLTLSGLKVRATDKLNGSIEGINAQVSSLCKDYNTTTNTWSTDLLPTSNPAALFRYVLQHPANIQAIPEAEVSEKIDLATIEDWYEFCETENLTYNAVILQRRSLLEVMRDICAAGRASPMLTNGKWSVVIDRPRTTVVQHFTPHNSWGFEGTRLLSSAPHALRVNVVSASTNYQTKEITVFSYSSKVMQVTTTAGSSIATISSTIPLHPNLSLYNSKVEEDRITVTSGASIPAGTKVSSITNSTTFVLSANASTTGTAQVTFNVPYYTETSTIFETISLPGVTNEDQAVALAKFHLAQSILRPETYSLNTDMEYLACTRGDLVRVTHDVPMWGLYTGRIKDSTSNVSIKLSEELLLEIGVTYTIRIRTGNGSSVVRNVVPVGTTGYYSTLTVTAALSADERAANNLFMLGTLNSESAQMLVTGIEPSSNLTAKISLVDYSPEVYTASTKFSALPSFNTQITSPIAFFTHYITSVPIISSTKIRSDESVMELSGASYIYKLSVPFTNPAALEKNVTDVEYRVCLTDDTSKSWRHQGFVKLSAGSLLLSDVVESQNYTIQLRYVSSSGFSGPWSEEVTHTIVGKATPPSTVTGLTAVTEGSNIRLNWNKSPEIDIVGYEIRTTDSGWGTSGAIFVGNALTCTTLPAAYGVTTTWYIKAIDAARNYSTTADSYSLTIGRPNNITDVTYTYSDNSTGQATVFISWTAPVIGTTNLASQKYLITFTRPVLGDVATEISANNASVTMNADWEGTASINVVTKDVGGNLSTGASFNIVKIAPSTPIAAATPVAVKGSGVTLNWEPSAPGSLPVAGYQLSTVNTSPTSSPFIFKGSASTINIGSISGSNTWYLWSFDTAGKYCATPLTISRSFGGASAPTISAPIFVDTTAIFKWSTPSSDFEIASYVVTLTAAGMTTKSAVMSTTEWEVPVDWVNTTATFTVYAKDVAGLNGTSANTTLPMTLPSAPTVPTFTVKGGGIAIGWTPAVKGSLPVAGYQLSTSNADPKLTSYVYKGNASTIDIPIVGYNNTWYLWAYDTMGNYSATSLTITKNYTGALAPTILTPVYADTTAIFKWIAPTSDFPIDSYTVTLTAPGMTNKTAILYTTEWEVPVDWVDTIASFTIYAKDVAGLVGATGNTTLAMTLPSAPTVPTFTVKGGGITIGWTSSTQGSLPVAGYQLSTSSTAPKTNPYLYKGNSSTIDVATVGYTNTWYLFAYDTLGNYSATPLTVSKNYAGPSAPVFAGIPGTNPKFTLTTAYFKWLPPSTSDFAIAYYNLTLSAAGMSTLTAKINTTEWEVPVSWSNTTATLTIVPVDLAGLSYTGSSNTITLTKTIPSTPTLPVLTEVGTNIDLDWADNTQNISTQLGIANYEIKDYDGLSLWRGSSSKAQISMIGRNPLIDVTWSRSSTTVTITENTHGLLTGNLIHIATTSSSAALPTGIYSIIVTDLNTYTVVGLNAGATTGTASKGYAYSLYAIDYNGETSTALQFTYTPALPININQSTFTSDFGNSLTDASLSLKWEAVTPVFGLDYYEVRYDSEVIKVSSTSLDILPLPINWIGNKVFTVRTKDLIGNISTGTSITVNKQKPDAITYYNAQVIDNNVMLYWSLPTRTSLPIAAVRVKKGTSWASAIPVGDKTGTFTTIFEQTGGTYEYWMAAVDTDRQEGPPISFPVTVSQPPDFIFNGSQTSIFDGTFSNAMVSSGNLVLPVNVAEAYDAHFTNIRVATMTLAAGGTGYAVGDSFRLNTGTVSNANYATGIVTTVSSGVVTGVSITQGGTYTVSPTTTAGATLALTGVGTGLTITITTTGNWATPSAQVSAGYPVFIQPTLATGYYEEVFDFGTVLASSQVTLTYSSTVIDGDPSIASTISTSIDNIIYSNGFSTSSVFATNFRYVKVRITASQSDVGKGLVSIGYINLRLDSKLIDWAGFADCVSTDTLGTIVNFGKEFVDVSAINVTMSGTTFAVPVYDHKDTIISATYVLSSNVCTVTTSEAHGLIAGQDVRLSFSSGSNGIPDSGVYQIITAPTTTTYTVALVHDNTSGNVSTYAESMRIYLFGSNGTTRLNGRVSWSIKGN